MTVIISFKDLIVWQRSMELAKEVYKITGLLPKSEIYAISSQMRRCAISIPSNIAEGNKRGTAKDYCQFLKIAQGSAAELETQILLLRSIYVNIEVQSSLSLLEEVQKMLTVIIKKLTAKTL